MINESQLVTALLASVPAMLTVLIGILINNSRLGDMTSRLSDMNTRISELRQHMDSRFSDVDRRFEEIKELWRSELHRVEEALDSRLKHLETR